MTRKALVFGNGLGMALDPYHFSLSNAIQHVWDHPDILSDDERRYIEQCLPDVTGRPPEGEHELDILHIAVTACGFLRELSGDDVEWLSDDGQKFPNTIARFMHKVATKLHNYEAGELPEDFIAPLCKFLKESKSHVATVNYDKLLYEGMVDRGVLRDFDFLVDGMWGSGFERGNLERLYGNDFGYYLHLHGSPLFVNNGNPVKKQRHELSSIDSGFGRHIVITHVKHKLSVISSSVVLSAYWNYLDFSLSESEEIVVFGYSGDDVHLNQKLKLYTSDPNRPTRIVEWSGSGDYAVRTSFWKSKLGDRINLIQMDNILEFTDW